MKLKSLYTTMAAGGVLGMVAAFLQLLEKLVLIQDKHAQLTCNLNSVLSCSNVLNSWQSSVFGFPNAIMCLVLFTVFTSMALVGMTGGKMPKGLRLAVQGLALFTLGFALWFLWESTYVIGSVCIFCLLCFTGLLLVNGAWLRVNRADLPLSPRVRSVLQHFMSDGTDIFAWFMLGLIVAGAIAVRLS